MRKQSGARSGNLLAPFDTRKGDRIRLATADDLRDLEEIAHQAKRYWQYPDEWIREWHEVLTLRAEDLTVQRVFVAETDGRAVGFCAVLAELATWSLEHMWVLPEFMGRGVGDALFRAAVRYVKSERGSTLTIESDPNAEGFYRRMGAKRVGRVSAPVGGRNRYLPVLELRIQ